MTNKPASFATVVTTALIAGGTELLQPVPGGATALATTLALVQTVFRRRAQQRATELFTAIGVATGAADPEDAAARLAQHIEEPWFQEAIEAGFRALMDSTDPSVRACIAVLVAEYIISRKPPDLKFRRAGSVLQGTAGSALVTLLAITNGYVTSIANATTGLRVLIRAERKPDADNTFRVAASQPHGKGMVLGVAATVTPNFEDCTRALVGGGVGQLWTGLSSSQFQGEPLIQFDSADDAVMQLLDICVRTALQRSGTIESTPVDE